MKRLVIKQPRPGRTTAELVTHRYFSTVEAAAHGRLRGTQTIRLGRVSMNVNPDDLARLDEVAAGEEVCGIKLKAGVIVDGSPFSLNKSDLTLIREWLSVHGAYIKGKRERELRHAEAVRIRLQEREVLLKGLRDEVRHELLGKQQQDDERRGVLGRLQDAVKVLDKASEAVVAEAERLKRGGVKLTPGRAEGSGATSHLSAAKNAILELRVEAFRRFEEACQTAGFMGRRQRRGEEMER